MENVDERVPGRGCREARHRDNEVILFQAKTYKNFYLKFKCE